MDVKKNNSYLTMSTATGAAIGAAYGFRHPDEQTCLKLSQLKPTVVETMKNYIDSFDMSAASKAAAEGKINLKEYTDVKHIVNNFTDVMQKEQLVRDIAQTPFEQRTTSFRQAVKEANAARPKLYKSMFKLQQDFKTKLIENNIFNQEKFVQATAAAKKKARAMYKMLSKCAFKGLAIGAAIGLAAGFALNKIVTKIVTKHSKDLP